jgi:hypothetical protein
LSGAGNVASFNARTGVVTLQAADVTGVGGALLASPTFTGTPQAPTAAPGTNSTQVATTAFCAAGFVPTGGLGAYAPLASPALTGVPTAPTAAPGTNTTQLATAAFVAASFLTTASASATYAPIASPSFTGTATAAALNVTGKITPSSTNGIVGTTAADNAVAGSIGEFITASQFTNQALTSATPLNILSLALTAGDWDVDGTGFITSSASVGTNISVGLSLTSATLPTPAAPGRNQYGNNATPVVASCILPTGRLRVNVAGATTVYLVALMTFGSGTGAAQGTIQARRMR